MCKKLQLRPQTPYRGFAPGPHWGDFRPPNLLIGQCLFWASMGNPPPKKKNDETEEPEARIQ